MTRISASIRATNLSDIHLRKERIEISRIPNKIKAGKYKSELIDAFTLNKGHELSMVAKCKYLHRRYNELTEECIKRGFNVTDYSDAFKNLPEHLYNDWDDNIPKVREIVSERIKERLLGMKLKDLKYYGKQKTAEELI